MLLWTTAIATITPTTKPYALASNSIKELIRISSRSFPSVIQAMDPTYKANTHNLLKLSNIT